MADRKTLNIDPNMFSFSNTTKKRRPSTNEKGIKIKQESPKKKNDSLKKKSILKMIRQHQSDRYKRLFEPEKASSTSNIGPELKNEFKEAQQFFENLTEKTEQKQKIQHHTLKQYPSLPERSLLMHPAIPPIAEAIINPPPFTGPPVNIIPQYGCLKNGSLPTYRNFMNKTQKNYPVVGGNNLIGGPNAYQSIGTRDVAKQLEDKKIEIMENKINQSMGRIEEIKQTAAKLEKMKLGGRPSRRKQKKTVKRTYNIGKSKVLPKVSVLVSNRTLRNNVSTQSQNLKQVPIDEVKKYLMKRGFIKVGSSSPNDVLRKMYESAVLICGEVQNHNPDNLLYNFLNSKE
jgi:hypothetical protein